MTAAQMVTRGDKPQRALIEVMEERTDDSWKATWAMELMIAVFMEQTIAGAMERMATIREWIAVAQMIVRRATVVSQETTGELMIGLVVEMRLDMTGRAEMAVEVRIETLGRGAAMYLHGRKAGMIVAERGEAAWNRRGGDTQSG